MTELDIFDTGLLGLIVVSMFVYAIIKFFVDDGLTRLLVKMKVRSKKLE